MSLEIAYALALLSGRTLVLPPSQRITFHQRSTKLEDFFEISGVDTCDFETFTNQWPELETIQTDRIEQKPSRVQDPWSGIEKLATTPELDPLKTVFCFPKIPSPSRYFADFLGGRRPVSGLGVEDEPAIVHFPGNLLGTFYTMVYSPRAGELRRAVRDGVRYRDWLYDCAGTVTRRLGQYSAMHVRRNDFSFAYHRHVPNIDRIAKNVEALLEPGERLYIATDETDHALFEPLSRRYAVIFARDIKDCLTAEGRTPEFLPLIEQILCAHGRVFVGTRLSTMSSYIYRLRGYLGAADTNYYVVSQLNAPTKQSYVSPSWRGLIAVGDQWTREFPEAWTYSPPRPRLGVRTRLAPLKRGLLRMLRSVPTLKVNRSVSGRDCFLRDPSWRLEPKNQRFVLRAPAGQEDLECDILSVLIWELCDGHRSIDQIVATLIEGYPEAAANIDDDVNRVVGQLLRSNSLLRLDSRT